MKLFKSKADPAAASTAESHDDAGALANETARLEEHIADDPAAKAALELAEFRMTPGAKSLLDRAMDNIAQNDGVGLDDPDARMSAQLRASLVNAAGGDLSVVIDALVTSCEEPKDIAPTLYSLGYNILKSAGFIANLDYRRYLDPRGDFDLSPYIVLPNEDGKYEPGAVREALGHDFYADAREETRDPPPGLDSTIDRENEFFRATYGADAESTEDIFACALEDLRLFLQLTVESFGWEADRPMPFAFLMDPDGSFTPINDPRLALDHYEIKRKESRARRRAKENTRMAAAAARAQELVKGALARKS